MASAVAVSHAPMVCMVCAVCRVPDDAKLHGIGIWFGNWHSNGEIGKPLACHGQIFRGASGPAN